MSITSGSDIVAADFVSTPSGAGDSGKVVKLDSTGKIPTGFMRFGGDGSDGALSITSGTTTIALGGVRIFIKNYTSISITSTGKLAFSGAHASGTIIVLKSQGNVTITSTATCIDASGMGGDGAGQQTVSNNSSITNNGGDGTDTQAGLFTCHGGGGGVDNTTPTAAAAAGTFTPSTNQIAHQLYQKYPFIFIGAGGGAGAASTNTGVNQSATSGAGGKGGACLLIECAGALNFTTASGISVAGLAGQNGQASGGNSGGATGRCGGGGAAGFCGIFYNSLTSASGTIVVTGGLGGTSNSVFGTGGRNSCGGNGGSSGYAQGAQGSTSVGGDGAVGNSLVAKNTEYA